jgi:hypothetical protein
MKVDEISLEAFTLLNTVGRKESTVSIKDRKCLEHVRGNGMIMNACLLWS